jgi:hypothetical protein
MTRADFSGDRVVEVWPDNWLVVQVFCFDLATQWRIGMAGPTGLDYAVLPFVLRTRKVPRSEWEQAFEDIRTMEQAALKEMHED